MTTVLGKENDEALFQWCRCVEWPPIQVVEFVGMLWTASVAFRRGDESGMCTYGVAWGLGNCLLMLSLFPPTATDMEREGTPPSSFRLVCFDAPIQYVGVMVLGGWQNGGQGELLPSKVIVIVIVLTRGSNGKPSICHQRNANVLPLDTANVPCRVGSAVDS